MKQESDKRRGYNSPRQMKYRNSRRQSCRKIGFHVKKIKAIMKFADRKVKRRKSGRQRREKM